MIRTIIIDDDQKVRKSLKGTLELFCDKVDVIDQADSVETGISAITKHDPDLVLLDIRMPDGTGFDLLKKIGKITFKLIFITAYEEHAVEAFKFSAIDYLLKPPDPDELVLAINKAEKILQDEIMHIKLETLLSNLNKTDSNDKKLVLKTIDKIHVVDINDIVHCESQGSYTNIFLNTNERIMVTKTLKEYDDLLQNYNFFRIHHSHLVNLKYVKHYERSGEKGSGGYVVTRNDDHIPVAYRKKEKFIELFTGKN